MMRRRRSPYDLSEKLEEARHQFWEMLIITIAMGTALGLFGAAAYEIAFRIFEHTLTGLLLVLALAVILIGVALHQWMKMAEVSHFETKILAIEVAIPYLKTGKDRIEVLKLHPYRPPYQPAKFARDYFAGALPPGSDDNRKLAFAWDQALMAGQPVQTVLRTWHNWLVEALILAALHRYSEEALGGEAKYKWHAVDMDARDMPFAELPQAIKENPVLPWQISSEKQRLTREDRIRAWKLHLPQDVTLTVDDVSPDVREYRLSFGPGTRDVTITRHNNPWVADARSQPGKVLGEGARQRIAKVGKGGYYVFGSRIQVRGELQYGVPPEEDPMQQWVTGLMSSIEEALDFGYFLQHRPMRMIPDIAWKVGDMNLNDSLARKLDGLQRQLNGLEKKLEGSQKQIAGLKEDIRTIQKTLEEKP